VNVPAVQYTRPSGSALADDGPDRRVDRCQFDWLPEGLKFLDEPFKGLIVVLSGFPRRAVGCARIGPGEIKADPQVIQPISDDVAVLAEDAVKGTAPLGVGSDPHERVD
jgi:hypothetical protein